MSSKIPIHINKDILGPSLTDVITENKKPKDLTGYSIVFRMRAANSSTLKVNAAGVLVTASEGSIRYDWASGDVNTAGEYFGWWRLTPPAGAVQETDEFPIIIDAHEPGDGVATGAIYQRVREHIPISLHALAKDERYGDSRIQSRIDFVKFKLFATVVTAGLEATVYNPLYLDFAGKIATLRIIPAAADYWSDQHQEVSATGTNENVSFPDRIANLWKIHERLLLEVKADEQDVEELIVARRRGKFPKVSTTGDLLTLDPGDFYTHSNTQVPSTNLPYYPFQNLPRNS